MFITIDFMNINNTPWAVILPAIFSPLGVFILRQNMIHIPAETIEAACIDGAGAWRIFLSIALPVSKTGLAALTVLCFIDKWNMIEPPLIFLRDIDKQPLSIILRDAIGATNYVYAPSILYMLPAILIYFLFKNALVDGLGFTETKIDDNKSPKSKKWNIVLVVAFVLILTTVLSVPHIAKTSMPVVQTRDIKGRVINSEYYMSTVHSSAITDSEEGKYIYIIDRQNDYWSDYSKCKKVFVEIIAENSDFSAVEWNGYGSAVLIEWSKEPRDGSSVLIYNK